MNFSFTAVALANPGSWFPWSAEHAEHDGPEAGGPAEPQPLPHRQMLRLPHPEGQLIVCNTGTLWVTVEGEPEDHVLEAGDCFLARTDAPVVVEALSLASMTVHPAAC